jgi:signal peptide peptidase SppA
MTKETLKMKLLEIINSPWAITPAMLEEIQNIYLTHLRGDKIDIKGVEARMGKPLNNEHREYDVRDGVAVIQTHGVIAKRMNLFTQISGGVSTEHVARDFKAAIEDPEVRAIIMDIDSPGGTVDGTQELAEVVYNARGKKPVVAFTDGVMTSGAYYIGSAADSVYISGDLVSVGSIGVITRHVDVSRAEEKMGIKTTDIFAGKYKSIASQHKPLSDEGRESIQDRIDYMYSIFVADVARYRGVSVDTVLEDMADGRIFIGRQAIEAGLVDGVSTFDGLVDKLAGGDSAISNKREVNSMSLTKETLKADHPALYQAVLDEGKALGMEEGTKAASESHKTELKEAVGNARAEGAAAEMQRIKDIESQGMPGHEKLIGELKFDGKTTGAEAAVKVLAAEKAKLSDKSEGLETDAAGVQVPASESDGLDHGDGEGEGLSVEDKAKAKWDKDAKLRTEYGGVFEKYLAYAKADAAGQVKVYSREGR